jgi:(p)ppGpp synthase/HD superfamily hydrolase
MWNQDAYQTAVVFAARAHQGQKIPGGEIPYVVHVCQVAMEVMASPRAGDLAMLCALLHDTLEDTETKLEDVARDFGKEVADGVLALTKNDALPKPEQMGDSLARIKLQPKEVWMVKLADRITNLQEPPHYWSHDKCVAYRAEAGVILRELGEADEMLARRLEEMIHRYRQYIDEREG